VPPVLTLAVVVYRAALHLYPPDFRREFGSEMVRDFTLGSQEAWSDRRWPSLVRLWADLVVDFARTVVAQWLQGERAAIALIPMVFAAVGIRIADQVLAAAPLAVAVAPADRDLIALMLLVLVVLLIVVATIVFTLWFAHPLFHRRRI